MKIQLAQIGQDVGAQHRSAPTVYRVRSRCDIVAIWAGTAMILDCIRYAWRGSVRIAAPLSSFVGALLLYVVIWALGRSDIIAPTTMGGRIGFVVACTLLAWCAIFLARLAWAPFHLLRKARAELARLRSAPTLEILFGDDPQFVRPIQRLYAPTGEFFSIGVRNSGTRTLDDVMVRALDSWFTREVLSVAQTYSSGSGRPVEIIRIGALHPGAIEMRQLFGIDYHQPSSAPEYIFNTEQRFTLEARARDTPAIRRDFEYNPEARPMLKMITE